MKKIPVGATAFGCIKGAIRGRQNGNSSLERHVFLAGFRTDALELTKGVDLFAGGSVVGGTGVALLDAMAASKAAVATSTGAIPEKGYNAKGRPPRGMTAPRD